MSDKIYVEQSAVLEVLQAAINKQAGKPDALQFVSDILDAPFVPPPADVKPVVRGEWVKVDDDLYRCSHCHSEIEMRDIYIAECKYCLVCGAEMRNRGEIDENAKRI